MSWAAGTTINTSDIWNYVHTKTASYIIRKNGSYYEAIHGTTGKLSYGGSGNNGGATGTSASSVIQATVDALKAIGTGSIAFVSAITLTAPLNLTDITGMEFRGWGRANACVITIQSSADVIFDCCNSRNLVFRNIEFVVDTGYTPKTVFLLARDSTLASVGDSVWDACGFKDNGGVTVGFVYNYGSELNSFRDCLWQLKGPAYYQTPDNKGSLTSAYATIAAGAQSTSVNRFRDNAFYCDNQTGNAIYLDHDGVATQFIGCYFGGAPTLYAITLGTDGGSDWKTTIRDCYFEKLAVQATNSGGGNFDVVGFTFVNNGFYLAAGNRTVIDANKTTIYLKSATLQGNMNLVNGTVCIVAAEYVDYCDIDFRSELYSFKLTADQTVRYSRIVVRQADHYTATGGEVNNDVSYFLTRSVNGGIATIASGTTSIEVTHNMGYTPNSYDILVTPTNDAGVGDHRYFWISGITDTHFHINVQVDPNPWSATFAWHIRKLSGVT